MVITTFARKLLKSLDKYLIKKKGFQLDGEDYDLVMIEPSESNSPESSYSIFISSKVLNEVNQKVLISELFKAFVNELTLDEYNSISRINILNTEMPFVKNMKMVFSIREPIFELNNYSIGGVTIEHSYVIKSLVLDRLRFNSVVAVWLQNGTTLKAGVIRIEKNYDVIYFTEKALNEIWNTNFPDIDREAAENLKCKGEDFLFANSYLGKIPFDNITMIR